MAYTPTYTEDDITPAAMDGTVKIILVFAVLAELILFIIILIFAKKYNVIKF